MIIDWIDERAMAKNGVERDFQEEWEAHRYKLGGKMFLMLGGDKAGRPILTCKLPPADGLILRETHPGKVVPGYYMNKQHWNSLYLDSDLDRAVFLSAIDGAYACMLASLPKKVQAALGGE